MYKKLHHAALYQKDSTRIKAQTAEYRDKVRDTSKVIVREALNRHARNGFTVIITLEEAVEIFETTSRCRYCQREMYRNRIKPGDLSYSLDRIDNGKALRKDNIQFICNECNRTKGARTHDEFITFMETALKYNRYI